MARKLSGVVVSDLQDKTIVVKTTTRKTHPIYGKSYLVSKKFSAHDEKGEAKKGDTVVIIESRPIAKNKRFVLSEITERGHENLEIKQTQVEAEVEAKVAEKKAKAEAKKAAEKTKVAEEEEAKDE